MVLGNLFVCVQGGGVGVVVIAVSNTNRVEAKRLVKTTLVPLFN